MEFTEFTSSLNWVKVNVSTAYAIDHNGDVWRAPIVDRVDEFVLDGVDTYNASFVGCETEQVFARKSLDIATMSLEEYAGTFENLVTDTAHWAQVGITTALELADYIQREHEHTMFEEWKNSYGAWDLDTEMAEEGYEFEDVELKEYSALCALDRDFEDSRSFGAADLEVNQVW